MFVIRPIIATCSISLVWAKPASVILETRENSILNIFDENCTYKLIKRVYEIIIINVDIIDCVSSRIL